MKSFKLLMAVAVALSITAVSRGDDTASISGKIKFNGTPPKRKKIKTDADPKCAEMHEDSPLLTEEEVVSPDGSLQNVFVYIKSGLTKTYDKPATPVEIHQTGCHYVPHVFGMMAGQRLDIYNDDDTLHNIHAMPTDPNNKEFNKGQPNKGMKSSATFAHSEVMVHFKCDVHPWMSAYVGVLDNPFYSVTGEDGAFSLKGLPAGTYEVAAWQEKYGEQVQKVTVGGGEAKTVDFKFTKPAE